MNDTKEHNLIFNKVKYRKTKYPNLYKSVDKFGVNGYKYLMKCKIEGVLYNKVVGFSNKDKLTDKKAKDKIEHIKTDIEAGYTSSSSITLNKLFELYFETLDPAKQWTNKKKYIYFHYVKEHLGKKKIEKIREMDIKRVLLDMSKRGLKPRTQKSVLEVTNPLFAFAVKNKYLKDNPSKGISVKVPNQKRIVTNASNLFTQVYNAITTLYEDEPFYQALFLFGFSGRRKNEVLTLQWEHIDFEHNYYWLQDTKNDESQKFELPMMIKEQLLKIKDDRRGLVFKSPTSGMKIINLDRQTRRIIKYLALKHCNHNPLYQAYTFLKCKEWRTERIYSLRWTDKLPQDIKPILERYKGVKKGLIFEDLELEKFDKLSFHYMRNVLVSSLAERGIEAITLSGILGHSDITTINRYLSVNYHNSSKIGYEKVNEILEAEVIDDEG